MKRQRYTLGSFLNSTLGFWPRALKKAWLPALACLLPSAVLMGIGFARMGPMLALFNEPGFEFGAWMIGRIVEPYAWLAAANLAAAVGYLSINIIISNLCFATQDGQDPVMAPTVRQQLRRSFWPLLGQSILLGLIMGGGLLIATGLIMLLAVGIGLATGVAGGSVAGVLLMMLLTMTLSLGLVAVLYWFMTRVIIAPQAVIREGVKAWAGIVRSFRLTKGNFWRIFGNNFLLQLMLGFAISIVTGPIVFVTVLPGYLKFFSAALNNPQDSLVSLQILSGLFSSMSWGMAFSTLLSGLASWTFLPIFHCLVYTDLAVRHGEVAPDELTSETPPTDAASSIQAEPAPQGNVDV